MINLVFIYGVKDIVAGIILLITLLLGIYLVLDYQFGRFQRWYYRKKYGKKD